MTFTEGNPRFQSHQLNFDATTQLMSAKKESPSTFSPKGSF